jgi:hypothetical protein
MDRIFNNNIRQSFTHQIPYKKKYHWGKKILTIKLNKIVQH